MANVTLPTKPSRGGTRSDEVLEGYSGEALTAGQAVVLNSSGYWIKADRDTDAVYSAMTLTTAAAANEPISVQIRGIVCGFSGLTPGVAYYLSDTAGSICPIADVGEGANFVPVGLAVKSTQLFVFGMGSVQVPNTPVSISTPAQGNIIYRGASAWAKLAVGTAGQMLTTGGASANPSWANPKQSRLVGPLADQGAAATVTVKLGSPATGRQWVPLRLQVLSGTTAGATAQAKFATVAAMDALTLDGDAETATFTDASVAAGQAVTVDLVTAADTGDLDAAVVIFEFADLPA